MVPVCSKDCKTKHLEEFQKQQQEIKEKLARELEAAKAEETEEKKEKMENIETKTKAEKKKE
jgi:endogenous inhibitor of DNA gyrase (YacG/DUF329 family)